MRFEYATVRPIKIAAPGPVDDWDQPTSHVWEYEVVGFDDTTAAAIGRVTKHPTKQRRTLAILNVAGRHGWQLAPSVETEPGILMMRSSTDVPSRPVPAGGKP
ncbi:hypothetical protein [Myceligenerans crystallogenes]|uniref:hypothetical protein n=1 Tax=Myceligenerans crystallogenes TaxID=316335 RepID=UPI0031E302D0